MELAIVTGASRGLGAALTKRLLLQGTNVIGISREENQELLEIAKKNQIYFQHYKCDLADTREVEKVFNKVANKAFDGTFEKVYLINNAGVVSPIDIAGNYDTATLSKHIQVNQLAPMTTTNILIAEAEKSSLPLVVVNVTSGAANRSVYGWSAYSSTKAAINRFTQTVALEQSAKETGNKAVLYDPGKMDTDMQGTIRSSSEEQFQDVEQFKQLKQANQLRGAEIVADHLVSVLNLGVRLESGKTYSIKDAN
ncbi:(S)-benzoin forming benzil reductase [Sediminibacillus halophilus]|uniref:Benzil reductase ((S)-benzoin forming) n=1 Tax=Sediminibacillus halophilus TaxID=482461 RepID=A0A1G9PUD9_9BACI|nr:(S)-benzoin forming benzil reductase [Sediminibacillus halophilus]SDM01857.1 benzil reductase ((S)-benzoin forming) [Sediminibacillus halophilus]